MKNEITGKYSRPWYTKLKFHAHTNTVIKKAYCVLGLISRSFDITLVHPIIEYNMFYGDLRTYIFDNQTLERIQRKATRIISSINHLSYHDRLRYLNLPSLQNRR